MPAEKFKNYVLGVGTSAVLLAGILVPALLHAESNNDQPGLTVETETEVEPVSGDVLSMPEQGSPDVRPISLPSHGMSMADVERRYGSPRHRHAAVGKPPITRWDYDAFSVFFEYRTVLHAVRPDKPAEITRKNELLGGQSRSSEHGPDSSGSSDTPPTP